MNKVVTKIPPHQNAKVLAILVALSMTPFVLLMLFFSVATIPNIPPQMFLMQIAMPIFYLGFVYVFFGLACIVYNKIQPKTGGFIIEVEDEQTNGAE
jgi:hypothetical protein